MDDQIEPQDQTTDALAPPDQAQPNPVPAQANPTPAKPLPWTEVTKKDEYQAMEPEQREMARRQYFSDVVSPQVPPEFQDAAKQQFDDQTKPTWGDAFVQTVKDFPHEIAKPIENIGNMVYGDKPIITKNLGETASNIANLALPFMGVPEDTAFGKAPVGREAMSLSDMPKELYGMYKNSPLGDEAGSQIGGPEGIRPTPAKIPQVTPSADDALKTAKTLYTMADEKGGVGGSQTVMNKWLDTVQKEIPKEEKVVTNARGGNPSQTQALIDNLETNRNQMVSYKGLDQLDKFLGNEAHQAFKSGDNVTGANIAQINEILLQTMKDAPAGTLPGAEYGEAARQAFTQQLKLRQLEYINSFAANTKNPATSLQAQARNLYNKQSKSKTSPWSPEELAAVDKMAKTGNITDLLQTVGNRLSIFAGGHGLLGKAAAYGISKAARTGANAIQYGKAGNVAGEVAKSIPSPYDIKGLVPRIQAGETLDEPEIPSQ